MDHIDDASIVVRVLDGETDAFEVLVRRYQPVVWAVVMAMDWNRSHLDDLVQEAFLKAYNALDTYDPGYPFARWLKQIVRNAVTDHLRARVREGAHRHQLRQLFSNLLRLREPEDDGERLQALRRCRDQLPERSRELVELFYEEGLSCQETAERMGMSTVAVHKALSRIRGTLRECIRQRIDPAG
ncbi:MAG: RNA polymerase sigma factor [Planctomycetota bacterium]